MSNPGCTEEQLREAAAAYIAHNGIKAHAASSLGLPENTFRNRLLRAAEIGLLGTDAVLPGYVIARTSETRNADGEITSQSITQKPETGDGQFQIPEGHKIKGLSTLTDGHGHIVSQWTKTSADQIDPSALAAIIGETLAGYEYVPVNIKPPNQTERDLATVYLMADWHIGLLSWKPETGMNWDLDIARDKIMTAVDRCVQSSPASEMGVVLGLGDLMHFDGYEPTTSRSKNILDADGRYPKVLRAATEMMAQSIALALEKHDQVLVRILPGNHDDQSAIAVSLALSMKYESNERVVVDDSPSRFWWWRWGKVLLGATHGDKIKMKDLPLVMAADCPNDWAASDYRKVYTGHIHHESKVEEGGVIVESMRAPVAKDAYHAGARYRSGRSISSETYAKDGGNVSRVSINL